MSDATLHAAEGRSFGGTPGLVADMFHKGRFQPWTYTPFLGGFLFSMATIVLRKNLKAMLATQGIIGVGTIAMANGVATSAIVKERSHN